MNRIALLGLLVFLAGCVNPNPYARFYHPYPRASANFAKAPVEPVVIKGHNLEADTDRMLGDGYGPVGYSAFNAAEADESGAVEYAKSLGAVAVVVYSRYSYTVAGSMDMLLPINRVPRINVQLSDQALPTTFEGAQPQPSESSAMGGMTVRNDYVAVYWVRSKPPSGMRVRNLKNGEHPGVNGVVIRAVVKDSPAARAGILRGDILTRIGATEIPDVKVYLAVMKEYAGQQADLSLLRGDREYSTRAQVGPPPTP